VSFFRDIGLSTSAYGCRITIPVIGCGQDHYFERTTVDSATFAVQLINSLGIFPLIATSMRKNEFEC